MDLYMDQRYDKATRDYLARFMDLTSQIFDLDSREAANIFVRGLVKGSFLHKRLLECPPYDLNELKSRVEGILRVEESRLQIAKNVVIVISQNNSWARDLKDYNRKTRDDNRSNIPTRDKAEDKRKRSNYSSSTAKRFKTDEGDFDYIFTMPQEKIFAELKVENVFR